MEIPPFEDLFPMLNMWIFQLAMFIFGVVFISTPALTCLWNLQVFDSNNDQRISREEFKSGLKKLSFLVTLKIPSWKNAHAVTLALSFNASWMIWCVFFWVLCIIYIISFWGCHLGICQDCAPTSTFFWSWNLSCLERWPTSGCWWLLTQADRKCKTPIPQLLALLSHASVFFWGSHQRNKNPRLFFDNPEISMVKMLQWSSSTYWIKIPLVRLHWKRSISFQTGLSGTQRMETAGKGRIQDVP